MEYVSSFFIIWLYNIAGGKWFARKNKFASEGYGVSYQEISLIDIGCGSSFKNKNSKTEIKNLFQTDIIGLGQVRIPF